MSKSANPTRSDSDAVFLGWQKTLAGDIFPIFNVTAADHPFFHSTVTEATLRKLNLRVPQIPQLYTDRHFQHPDDNTLSHKYNKF